MTTWIARTYLKLTGWEPEGEKPSVPKCVLIAAPHTSNWDFAYLLAISKVMGFKISWIGKHTLFFPPLGWLMRRVGGIAVVRHQRGNVVEQLAKAFEETDELTLVVPAEGTRGHVTRWKSGFYHIARSANVPVVLGYLDYARRRGGIGPTLELTGNIGADMDVIREFYTGIGARYPEKFGTIKLREET